MRTLLAASLAAISLASVADGDDTIETLVISGSRLPVAADLYGGSVSVLSAQELQDRQVLALSDVLRSVPGVAVSRAGGIGSQTQLRLRGAEANHVLVFIDGVIANDPAQANEFNFAHLLNDRIGRLEVLRGPQSALWGSEAAAGVIHVRSALPEQGSDLSLAAEAGSDDYTRFSASGATRGSRWYGGAGVTQAATDGYNLSRSGSEADGYDNTTLRANLGGELGDAVRIESALRYTDASNDFDGTDFATGLLADRDNRSDVEQLYGRLALDADTFDARWTHRFAVNLTDTNNVNRTENAFAPGGFDVNTAAAEALHYTYQSSLRLADRHRVTAAVEYQEQDYRQRGPVGFGDPNRDESMDWTSWIGEYRGELSDAFSLQASLRHDRNSDFDDATTGRLSAAWRLADKRSKLRAAYATGVKNPTFTERYGFFLDFIGNPDLQPETSKGWEAGIDHASPNGALQLSATWFEEALEDEINGFVFDPASGGFTSANETGDSERRGLELSADWLLDADLYLSLAYTWLDASEDDGSGRQVTEIRRAEHIANLNLDWQATAALSLNLNVDYNGEQDDFFFPPVPPFQERVTLDDYTLVNLAIDYRVSDGFSLFARAENLFDEDYQELFSYAAPGRGLYLGLRYHPLGR